MTLTAEEALADARRRVDAELARWAQRLEGAIGGSSGEAVSYALRTPGKRIRPALVLAAYGAAGGTHPAIDGVAAAVEVVHTYSLVHDDLPCMDDDDHRRGRPTTHRRFDVETAMRAGYGLVPVAAEVLADASVRLGGGPLLLQRLGLRLFRAGGITGMVGGQWLDLEAEGRALTLDSLRTVHAGKTGALIQACCELGGIAAGADADLLAVLEDFGRDVGLAFQVADDVLDATGTTAHLGKTAGRDAALGKSTYVSLLGVPRAAAEAERLAAEAVVRLAPLGPRAESLRCLARYIVERSR